MQYCPRVCCILPYTVEVCNTALEYVVFCPIEVFNTALEYAVFCPIQYCTCRSMQYCPIEYDCAVLCPKDYRRNYPVFYCTVKCSVLCITVEHAVFSPSIYSFAPTAGTVCI